MLDEGAPFFQNFWGQPCAGISSVLKLGIVYLCVWAILDKYNSGVIATKNIYFLRYCNQLKLNLIYLRNQLTEICQHMVEPQKLWKKGAP